MISLVGVSKRFGSKEILKGIDLTLASGQTHVLLGSSGCGKSTLLRIIMGVTRPDTGEVSVQGLRLSPATQQKMARQIGYVIQDGGLFPHLSGADNVTLLARVLGKRAGWGPSRIRARFDELSSLMGFEPELLKRFPRELSGGQRQRVGLMRALMLDPSVLLLDEPLGALDPIVRATLRAELKRIFNQLKKTVLIVTHDLDEAAFFGHTITLLGEGKIEQHGELSELLGHPSTPFVKEFINAQKPTEWLTELL